MSDGYEPEVLYQSYSSSFCRSTYIRDPRLQSRSRPAPAVPKIELSVVQSPKIFGMDPLNHTDTAKIENDERVIERHISDTTKSGFSSDRPSRPSSAPVGALPPPAVTTSVKDRKKTLVMCHNAAKSIDLASPIKISTGNMMLGLNPLLTLPPISPNLRSPICSMSNSMKMAAPTTTPSKALRPAMLPGFLRKRSGSFTTEMTALQPPKKRFIHENGKESNSYTPPVQPHEGWQSQAVTTATTTEINRSLSVETVAAFDHSGRPKVEESKKPTPEITDNIPKSYPPEFDLEKQTLPTSTIVTPTPMLPRSALRPHYDAFAMHMRPRHTGTYSSTIAARFPGPPRPMNPHLPAQGVYPMTRPYHHSRAPPQAGSQNPRPPQPHGTLQQNIVQEIRSLPQGECFQLAMATWQWYNIDGVDLPCVLRSGEKYVAVHMVQMKLLAKFPPNVPQELMRKHRMVSYKMSVLESWVLNTVNAVHCKFDFGYQLFSPADDLVRGLDVQKFYFSVKLYNYDRIIDVFRHEINATAELHVSLTAHISSLKACAEEELATLNVAETYENGTPPYVTQRSALEVDPMYRVPMKPATRPPPASHHYMNGHSELRGASKTLAATSPFMTSAAGLTERSPLLGPHAALLHNSYPPGAGHPSLSQRPFMRSPQYSLPLHHQMGLTSPPSTREHQGSSVHHMMASYPHHRIHANGHPF